MKFKNLPKELQVTRIVFFLVFVIVSIVILTSYIWNIEAEYNNAYENARLEAESSYLKDIQYRKWATMHGGVYVPVTPETPPNEFLYFVKDRDIETPGGIKLTLMNPAYMTRQVHEISDSAYGFKAHITSLKPIRPLNMPDKWEEKALKTFENGKELSYSSIELIDGKEYLRYMHAFITEKRCLKCHAQQGYKEGDIRGGLSISVPMAKHYAVAGAQVNVFAITHLIVWIIFTGLLFYSNKAISKEIYKRITANEKVAESEERYRSTFFISPDAININAMNGTFTDVNEGFTRLTGYTIEDVIGKSSLDINFWVKPDDRKLLVELLQKNGIVENFESDFRLKDGTIKTGLMSARIIMFKGVPHILSYTRDISERKQIENDLRIAKEKAEESDRLKSSFLANMSHEIRTPMNGILGFAQLLDANNLDDEERHEYIQFIRKRGHDLLNIINDILDISKIEADQLNLKMTQGDVNKLIFEVHDTFKTLDELRQKPKLQLLTGRPLAEGASISADFVRLRQILNNLISNAIKFTSSGKVEFGVEVINDNQLQFYVKDTGIGIDQDKLEIIFERFRQGDDDSLSRKFGGSGLGLAIAKGLTELMAGKIWIESQVGHGTTVYFTIPYYPTIPVKPKVNDTEKLEYKWANKTILLIEDDETNVRLILKYIQSTKAKYLVAYNGNSALEIFKNNPSIDLILLDIQLPDINGYNLAKKLLEVNPSAKIIAQTAYAFEENKKLCLEAGCCDFIPKPLDKDSFISIVHKNIKNGEENLIKN